MGIKVRSGKDWKQAIEIMSKAADEANDGMEDLEKSEAVSLLRKNGLEEQANEVEAMSTLEWEDFSCNHFYE